MGKRFVPNLEPQKAPKADNRCMMIKASRGVQIKGLWHSMKQNKLNVKPCIFLREKEMVGWRHRWRLDGSGPGVLPGDRRAFGPWCDFGGKRKLQVIKACRSLLYDECDKYDRDDRFDRVGGYSMGSALGVAARLSEG